MKKYIKTNASVPYRVTLVFDYGGPEDGPIIEDDWVIVYADSADEACKIASKDYADDRNFCGATYARVATPEERTEYQEYLERPY